MSARTLPGLLATFQSLHPDVKTTVLEGNNDEVNGWLINHFVDVSFAIAPPVGSLDVVTSVSNRFLFLAPTGHHLAYSKSVSLKQIQNEPYIQLKGESAHVIKEAFKQQGLVYKAQYEVSEAYTILKMIGKDIGVSILPEMAVTVYLPNVIGIELNPSIAQNVLFAVRDMNRISSICADFALLAKEYAEQKTSTSSELPCSSKFPG